MIERLARGKKASGSSSVQSISIAQESFEKLFEMAKSLRWTVIGSRKQSLFAREGWWWVGVFFFKRTAVERKLLKAVKDAYQWNTKEGRKMTSFAIPELAWKMRSPSKNKFPSLNFRKLGCFSLEVQQKQSNCLLVCLPNRCCSHFHKDRVPLFSGNVEKGSLFYVLPCVSLSTNGGPDPKQGCS